jgi:hypothetical protein
MKNVWYVNGDPDAIGLWPTLFDTKEAAEAYARLAFPDESENRRYARVYFRTVITLADFNGG